MRIFDLFENTPKVFKPNKLRLSMDKSLVYVKYDGRLIGRWMLEDITDNKTCVHSRVDSKYRKMGIGSKVYDYVERRLAKQGKELIPSYRLSKMAYQFWMKRDASKLKHHTVLENPEPNLYARVEDEDREAWLL